MVGMAHPYQVLFENFEDRRPLGISHILCGENIIKDRIKIQREAAGSGSRTVSGTTATTRGEEFLQYLSYC
jgi:hypothetical protein